CSGSVVIPLKALVLNTLSLSATFGAMVWIFQEGHLSGLYPDLTTTGYLVPTMPLLMFCVAFGLSMDYEVFLLSRIREAWLASGRTTASNTPPPPAGPDDGRRHPRGRQRAGAHGPDRDRGRAVDGHRLRLDRDLGHLVHDAVRHRPDPGRADGRHRRPRHPRAGVHAAGGPVELVGA